MERASGCVVCGRVYLALKRCGGESWLAEIARKANLSRQRVSFHLREMERVGLVERREYLATTIWRIVQPKLEEALRFEAH